ncbi:MAG: dTDP-4-dehydrorhamnose reductase [Acidobacteriaceae bacterium]|nr:dTDP-4-dehydrorhamnose reductase [Acidobacteriaceae bacterium]
MNAVQKPVILLTGAGGQLGSQLQHALAPLGHVVATDSPELDLTSPVAIREAVRALKPHWIVNTAAYTAVDKAESEPALAFALNRDAPALLAEEAARIGAVMVHYSTDYVFDGSKQTPYVESDAPNPLSVYGASKLAGEQAVSASGAAYFTFRTSWVYGATGKNFLLSILKLARERDELRIVADQYGAPTWSFDLAATTATVMGKIIEQVAHESRRVMEAAAESSGTYHACNGGETTWFGFTEAAVRLAQQYWPAQKFARMMPITTAEYPTAVRRPANSRLDCGKLMQRFGCTLPIWDQSLTQVMEAVAKESLS